MLLLNSASTNIVNSKYQCYSDSGMSTMGWQSHQHQHQHQQCNAHSVQTLQQSQVQSLTAAGVPPANQYPGASAHSWAMKANPQNGGMMSNNYPSSHNGMPMANMTNYAPQANDPYTPMQKMYNAPNNNTTNSTSTTTTKGPTGAG